MAKDKNLSRRDILKFSAAGAAGLCALGKDIPALAGNKFSDARAAEFVELPPKNAEKYFTSCRYCHVQCGYEVFVWPKGTGRSPESERFFPVEKMRGDWPNPVFTVEAKKDGKDVNIMILPDHKDVASKSNYSVRGAFNARSLYSEKLPTKIRLKKPMIRSKGKGSPLVEVSWDEAIGFTADKFQGIIDKHGPDAIAGIYGDWGYLQGTYAFLKWLFQGVKSGTLCGNGYLFWGSELWGLSDVTGSGSTAHDVTDYDQTKCMFLMGKNLKDTGSSWYYRALTSGGLNKGDIKLIVADPVRTSMARDAERTGGLFLQVKPGSDATLAMSIMHEVIKNEWHDKEFISRHTTGFEKLRKTALLKRFAPENASRITGVPASKIRKAAEMLGRYKGQTMFQFWMGIIKQVTGWENQIAFASLACILGNAGKPGACISRGGGHPWGTFAATSPPKGKGPSSMRSVLDKIEKGEVHAIWAYINNVYVQLPNLNKFIPKYNKTFLVVNEIYPTDTTKAADVIFPAATWGEWNTIQASEDRRLHLQQKFMDAPGDAKPDWWVVSQLAKKMGLKGFDWKDEIEIYNEVRPQTKGAYHKDISEISWNDLLRAGSSGIKFPVVKGRTVTRLHSRDTEKIIGRRFAHKNGKAQLEHVAKLAKFDPYNYPIRDKITKEYPLWNTHGRANEIWNTGYNVYNNSLDRPLAPELWARVDEQIVNINPQDARVLGIKSGDRVVVTSRQGSMKAMAKVGDATAPGVTSVWSHYPKRESTPNLITSDRTDDKLAVWDKPVPVNIKKI